MLNKVLTVTIILAILGLLTLQRFSIPRELPVRIGGATNENPYGFGNDLRRGSNIKTTDGFLEITIGEANEPRKALTHIWLSKNTTIILDRLYENGIVIRLTRGRIVASTRSEFALAIKTNGTDHLIHKGSASFVNYDFLETVHAIPIDGSIQTTIKNSNENLVTPVPLSIHETNPVAYSTLEVNLAAGDSKEFYEWAEVLTNENKNK